MDKSLEKKNQKKESLYKNLLGKNFIKYIRRGKKLKIIEEKLRPYLN
jgi:hypothetical protein